MNGVEAPEYSPLDSTKKEIRLLALKPGSSDSPLECSLFTTALDVAPDYECLSYTWGDSESHEQDVIKVGRRVVPVTPNLRHALHRLRPSTGPGERIMWIDALCIDQQNVEEKGFQVALMSDIYSGSAHTVAWLGEEVEEEDAKMAGRVGGNGEKLVDAGFQLLWHCAADEHPKDFTPRFSIMDGSSMATESFKYAVAGIEAILERGWWNRVWTTQEAVLPKSITIKCGSLELPLETLDLAYDLLMKHIRSCCKDTYDDVQSLMRAFDHFIELKFCKLIHEGATLSTGGFTGLKLALAKREAKDKRDKIFGFYGLLDRQQWPLEPDYIWPLSRICREVTFEQIARGAWEILTVDFDFMSPLRLPSWAVDFGRVFLAEEFRRQSNATLTYTKHLHRNKAKVSVRRHSENVISLTGRRVGVVQLAKSEFSRGEVAAVLARDTYAPTGEPAALVLVRAALQDCTHRPSADGTTSLRRTNAADRDEMLRTLRESGDEPAEAAYRLYVAARHLKDPRESRMTSFVTVEGHLGLSQTWVCEGDVAYLFDGFGFAAILRPARATEEEAALTGGRPCYRMVGMGSVYGFLDGEIYDVPGVEAEEVFLK